MLQAQVLTHMGDEEAEIDEDMDQVADYGLSEDSTCQNAKQPEKSVPAPKKTLVEVASSVEEIPATTASAKDPPGAMVLKILLVIAIVLLILDGVRREYKVYARPEDAGECNEEEEESREEPPAVRIESAKKLVAEWEDMLNAAKSGDVSGFNKALSNNPSVTQADAWGCTPLHYAAAGGSEEITTALLDKGAKVDACDAYEETALHFAARADRASICDVLLDAGANMDAINDDGRTPLVVAGYHNAKQAARALTERGAGAGGLKDEELPLLVVSEVVRKMFEIPTEQ